MSKVSTKVHSRQNHSQQHIVEVLIPVAVEQTYSYLVPPEMEVQTGALVIVPFGSREVTGVIWHKGDVSAEKAELQKLKSILQLHDCPTLSEDLISFITWVANYTISPIGLVLRMILRTPSGFEPEPLNAYYKIGPNKPDKLTPARKRILANLQGNKALTKAELAKTANVSSSVINALIKQEALETIWQAPPDDVATPKHNFKTQNLNKEQQQAAKQLSNLVHEGGFRPALLQGVTGSGKTEVYFEAIAEALKKNRQILLLLPEIALTGTFIKRFAARFGTEPSCWHSAIPQKHRARIWRGAATGKIQIVIGARSALFLPFKKLGLIIVDEEHESAYKQEDGVIYHARDMAVVRAHLAQFPIILASATPSLETLQNAETKRYTHVQLKKRYAAAEMPQISVIDMRSEGPESKRWLSPFLIQKITETLENKQQSLLFLNRRGYAPLTLCRQCGYRFHCATCSAWLVEHRFRSILACHHCGHQQTKPETCPQCHADGSLAACGPGVERIAEEVETLFPEARTLVLSSDLSGNLHRLRSELEAIANGQIDIVIGTQLIAKGHNFPLMRLIGIVDADLALNQADPRAAERSFQMLTQVTGRAGRKGGASLGLIQSYQPDHPMIDALVENTPDSFYQRELASRKAGQLPPFGRLAALIISGPNRQETLAYAAKIAKTSPTSEHSIRILGPAEAPLALIRGRHRFRILVQASKNFDLPKFIHVWRKIGPKPRGSIRIQVDMDPMSFF